MDLRVAACVAIAERCARGELSPQVALMEMLIATEDIGLLETALGSLAQRADSARYAELARVFGDNREGCARIAAQLRVEQTQDGERSVAESLAFSRALFDELVTVSEETSVALYSLGSPEILAAASEEIVAQLGRRRLLSPLVRVLDMGVGIGRMARALSPHVARIDGIDISPQMVAVAQRRCADLANVFIDTCSGSDFAGFAADSFELVLAVDSFPYVVSAGESLVQAIFAEAARVLVPGGHLVILNFSYRNDLALDCAEASALAKAHGFLPDALGELPFSLWNGALFALRARDETPTTTASSTPTPAYACLGVNSDLTVSVQRRATRVRTAVCSHATCSVRPTHVQQILRADGLSTRCYTAPSLSLM